MVRELHLTMMALIKIERKGQFKTQCQSRKKVNQPIINIRVGPEHEAGRVVDGVPRFFTKDALLFR